MTTKVALINMKGGVGKSTLAVNLAWHFAAYKSWSKKVLLVDLDPQFNASQYLIGAGEVRTIFTDNLPTVWDVFEQFAHAPGKRAKPLNPEEVIHKAHSFTSGGCIDLIPSRLELAYSLQNPSQKEQLLSNFLSKIEDKYDLFLLDCAPTESVLTIAAYLASDFILVPVKPDFLSVIGLPLLSRSLQEFRQHYEKRDLEVAGIVFNATSGYSPEEVLSKRNVQSVASSNGWYVFKAEISYSRSYPKGAREGQPIFRTSYARMDQANRFYNFAVEFAKRVRL